ncbi:MAG: hypothetical protein Q7J38_07030 [Gallionella sp.]|nr:hypothetical protein [Gallionella sp.]
MPTANIDGSTSHSAKPVKALHSHLTKLADYANQVLVNIGKPLVMA